MQSLRMLMNGLDQLAELLVTTRDVVAAALGLDTGLKQLLVFTLDAFLSFQLNEMRSARIKVLQVATPFTTPMVRFKVPLIALWAVLLFMCSKPLY